LLNDFSDSSFDLGSRKAEQVNQFVGLARRRNSINSLGVEFESFRGEFTGNGFKDTTFSVMVFNDQASSLSFSDVLGQSFNIEGLNGEQIDQSDVNAFTSELLDSFPAFREGNGATDKGDNVLISLDIDLRFTDFELFVALVQDGGGGSGGSDVSGALVVSSQKDGMFSGDSIRRIENYTISKGSELSEIFQGHLGGTIFTDRDTAMRADVFDVDVGDGTHSHLIESSGEESSEGRDEGNSSSDGDTLSNTDQVLFSNETFNEVLRIGVEKGLGESGVLGITVQRDQVAGLVVGVNDSLQSVTISLSSGIRLGGVVLDVFGEGENNFLGAFSSEAGESGGELNIGVLDELSDVYNGFLAGVAQRLTVPVELVFDLFGKVLSLEGLGEDSERLLALVVSGGGICLDDFSDIMTINADSFPSERLESSGINFSFVLLHGGLGLTKGVDVNDSNEVAKVVVSSEVGGFPDGSFSALTITEQGVEFVLDLVHIFGGISHTSGNGETLSEGSGGYVNEVESGDGVTFKLTVDVTESLEGFLGEETIMNPADVKDGGVVTLGKDEFIIGKVLGVLRVVVHTGFVEEKDSQELSRGRTGSGVTRFGLFDGFDDVNSEDVGQVSEVLDLLLSRFNHWKRCEEKRWGKKYKRLFLFISKEEMIKYLKSFDERILLK